MLESFLSPPSALFLTPSHGSGSAPLLGLSFPCVTSLSGSNHPSSLTWLPRRCCGWAGTPRFVESRPLACCSGLQHHNTQQLVAADSGGCWASALSSLPLRVLIIRRLALRWLPSGHLPVATEPVLRSTADHLHLPSGYSLLIAVIICLIRLCVVCQKMSRQALPCPWIGMVLRKGGDCPSSTVGLLHPVLFLTRAARCRPLTGLKSIRNISTLFGLDYRSHDHRSRDGERTWNLDSSSTPSKQSGGVGAD